MKCDVCGFESETEKGLKIHVRKKHNKKLLAHDLFFPYVEVAYVKDGDMLLLSFDKTSRINNVETENTSCIVTARIRIDNGKVVGLVIPNVHKVIDLKNKEDILNDGY